MGNKPRTKPYQAGQYSKKVFDYFKKPKHVGVIKDADGVGRVGNPTCGDMMDVYIKIKNNRIAEIRFKTFGCIAAISSTEALCRIAKGKTLEQAEKITAKDIMDELQGLPAIKVHCSVLGADALRKAITEYRKNKTKPKADKKRYKKR